MESNKLKELKKYLLSLKEQGICLAFSGGVDSAFLLYLCKDLNPLAVTVKSIFQTEEEIEFTEVFCRKYNIKHKVITFNPLDDNEISTNPKDRCYKCKKRIFAFVKREALQYGLSNVLDGTNYDDLNVYRPGLKALNELKIISPFAKFGITKKEIREFAKADGLDFYDKPSNPCAATRFPYGTDLTEEMVNKVKAAERFLKAQGFSDLRARVHREILRLEIPKSDFYPFLDKKNEIVPELKTLGYRYITLEYCPYIRQFIQTSLSKKTANFGYSGVVIYLIFALILFKLFRSKHILKLIRILFHTPELWNINCLAIFLYPCLK